MAILILLRSFDKIHGKNFSKESVTGCGSHSVSCSLGATNGYSEKVINFSIGFDNLVGVSVLQGSSCIITMGLGFKN